MSVFRSFSFRIIVGLLAGFSLLSYYISTTSSSPHMEEGRTSSGPIAGLDISLHQSSTSPPTITVTVANTNDHPVTVLRYGSPLDQLAVGLGLLSITPAGADAPLDIPQVQVRRMWPPRPDMLVNIAPGESATSNIVLKAPAVSLDKLGAKASVVLKGQWDAVWAKEKDTITKESLANIPKSEDVSTGDYESKSLDITIG